MLDLKAVVLDAWSKLKPLLHFLHQPVRPTRTTQKSDGRARGTPLSSNRHDGRSSPFRMAKVEKAGIMHHVRQLGLHALLATLVFCWPSLSLARLYTFETPSDLADFTHYTMNGPPIAAQSGPGINYSQGLRPGSSTIDTLIYKQAQDPTAGPLTMSVAFFDDYLVGLTNSVGVQLGFLSNNNDTVGGAGSLTVDVRLRTNGGLSGADGSIYIYGMDMANGLTSKRQPAIGGYTERWYLATFGMEPLGNDQWRAWGSLQDLGSTGTSTPQTVWSLPRDSGPTFTMPGLFPQGAYAAFRPMPSTPVDNVTVPEPGSVAAGGLLTALLVLPRRSRRTGCRGQRLLQRTEPPACGK